MTRASNTEDLTGKTAIVTGANTGIGKVTARELAARGARVILACRSADKTRPVVEEIRTEAGNTQVEFLELDLANLHSVRRAAEKFLARDQPLDILINNAGLAGHRGTTDDGFEIQFGVNHIGPYLFTRLLLSALEAAPNARIVNVSSHLHAKLASLDLEGVRRKTKTITAMPEYARSKLANIMFSNELAKRVPAHVHTYSVHPGGVASDVWRRIPWPIRPIVTRNMISVEDGAQTSLYCATSPEVADHTGRYYAKCAEREPSKLAQDPWVAQQLWQRSETWCKRFLD